MVSLNKAYHNLKNKQKIKQIKAKLREINSNDYKKHSSSDFKPKIANTSPF